MKYLLYILVLFLFITIGLVSLIYYNYIKGKNTSICGYDDNSILTWKCAVDLVENKKREIQNSNYPNKQFLLDILNNRANFNTINEQEANNIFIRNNKTIGQLKSDLDQLTPNLTPTPPPTIEDIVLKVCGSDDNSILTWKCAVNLVENKKREIQNSNYPNKQLLLDILNNRANFNTINEQEANDIFIRQNRRVGKLKSDLDQLTPNLTPPPTSSPSPSIEDIVLKVCGSDDNSVLTLKCGAGLVEIKKREIQNSNYPNKQFLLDILNNRFNFNRMNEQEANDIFIRNNKTIGQLKSDLDQLTPNLTPPPTPSPSPSIEDIVLKVCGSDNNSVLTLKCGAGLVEIKKREIQNSNYPNKQFLLDILNNRFNFNRMNEQEANDIFIRNNKTIGQLKSDLDQLTPNLTPPPNF